ncbi:hypothetical protein CLG85_001640 [Yangia mangrovi]|uniref:Twin-arginine translocation signal domain-containing protein n=1 Tax=Alloyangia mangrovi TaxID=1779329 RepID=A0ABT2KH30_9RHOB|nr:hypothetical protein [Alloyangia mangrovi]MCT4369112.1 hypothetical protein [Alloyangia mangrovi]
MKVLNRRGFIKSAPITALLAATPAVAFQAPITETPDPDPIPDWLNQWKAARAQWDEAPEGSADDKALWTKAEDLAQRIQEATPRTHDGAVAQLEWVIADSTEADFQYGHREVLETAVASLRGGLV